MRDGAVREPEARAALLVGCCAGFCSGVWILRALRLGVLMDPDPSWAPVRVALALLLPAGAAAVGVAIAGAFLLWSRTTAARDPIPPLPWRRGTIALLAAAAIAAGAALRLAALESVPESLFLDDVSLIPPTLALTGSPRDFSDSIRPVPYGVPKLFGTVGVLYLELFRACLDAFGTTVLGLRLPSALAGIASIATAILLGRALLPGGGGALAGLLLAGLRWHLIASRWEWVMLLLAPVLDIAALLALRARRRRAVSPAAASGVVAGLGAHIYLSAWSGAAGLGLLLLWPTEEKGGTRRRLGLAIAFGAGFLLSAAPLFLLREGRTVGYFERTRDHNLAREIRYNRSLLPAFSVAADALASPWLVPDPTTRQDLPGKNRLGLVLGLAVGVALGRAMLRPREDLSAYLLCAAIAAFASTVPGGQSGNPNGARYAYLTTTTAVAAAAGLLALLALVSEPRRRTAALALVGVVLILGSLGARDALARWSQSFETYRGFHGFDTRIGRAAARWDRFGEVAMDSPLGHSPVTIGVVRRYRLDPDEPRENLLFGPRPQVPAPREIRVLNPQRPAPAGARLLERVTDPRGAVLANVYGAVRRP